jgi:hypothetical protein
VGRNVVSSNCCPESCYTGSVNCIIVTKGHKSTTDGASGLGPSSRVCSWASIFSSRFVFLSSFFLAGENECVQCVDALHRHANSLSHTLITHATISSSEPAMTSTSAPLYPVFSIVATYGGVRNPFSMRDTYKDIPFFPCEYSGVATSFDSCVAVLRTSCSAHRIRFCAYCS